MALNAAHPLFDLPSCSCHRGGRPSPSVTKLLFDFPHQACQAPSGPAPASWQADHNPEFDRLTASPSLLLVPRTTLSTRKGLTLSPKSVLPRRTTLGLWVHGRVWEWEIVLGVQGLRTYLSPIIRLSAVFFLSRNTVFTALNHLTKVGLIIVMLDGITILHVIGFEYEFIMGDWSRTALAPYTSAH